MTLRRRPILLAKSYHGAVFAAALVGFSTHSYGQVHDTAVKAAYIYNFSLLTNWPAVAVHSPKFNVCVTGAPALLTSLQQITDKTIEGRRWEVSERPLGSRDYGCDVIVLGDPTLPSPDGDATALVVRDGASSGKPDAAIFLVTDGDHVRFDIDRAAALRRGLQFSSKLLSLARNIL